jgi:pimeloyl-ACP methyl ester carboxylesterase
MSTIYHLPAPGAGLAEDSIIALHCSASSGRQWAAYPALLPPGMRLIAPELMGYGTNPEWQPDTVASLEDEAQRLRALLHAAPHGVHLVGHSYGGAVALQMALLWPERIRSLTLYEPVRFALLLADPAYEPVGRSIVATGRRIRALALAGRSGDAAAAFVDYWSGLGAWDLLPPERRQAVAARMHKVGAEFEALFADTVPACAYASLPMPIRLIAGTRSPMPGRGVVELLAIQCRHATVVRLPGMGHMAPISHPQAVIPHLAFQAHDGKVARAA